jgi:hypothetical protein
MGAQAMPISSSPALVLFLLSRVLGELVSEQLFGKSGVRCQNIFSAFKNERWSSTTGSTRRVQSSSPSPKLSWRHETGFSDSPRAWSRLRGRGGAGWRLTWLLFSAGVEEECPLRFARSLARPSTHSLSEKASESSLQAMVRLGTSSRSRDTGLGTEGTRGAPPRSHRPIQVRRTQAS